MSDKSIIREIMESGLLDVSQVAKVLGVSVTTVYRLVWEGSLESLKVRRSVKIPRRSLEKYIENQLGRL